MKILDDSENVENYVLSRGIGSCILTQNSKRVARFLNDSDQLYFWGLKDYRMHIGQNWKTTEKRVFTVIWRQRIQIW
jgi:hypothetical protein